MALPEITFEQFHQYVKELLKRTDHRAGVSVVSKLYYLHPDLYHEMVHVLQIDPYYNDDLIPYFLEVVEAKWPSPR